MPSKWSEIRNNLNLTQEEWDKIEAEKSLIREQVKQRKERKMSEIRLIDADALMDTVFAIYRTQEQIQCLDVDEQLIMLTITAAPTIAPVRGEWVHDGHNFCSGVDWCHCSVCGMRDGYDHAIRCNYCPNCGSKMGGEE